MQGEQKLIHVCEVCGKTKIMTPEQRVTLARIQNEPTSIMPPK